MSTEITKVFKDIKSQGFEYISLTKKNGYLGASDTFDSDKKKSIAVCYGISNIFVVEDKMGLFNHLELVHSIIKSTSFSVENVERIAGATVIAFLDADGDFHIVAKEFERLGLDTKGNTVEEMERKLKSLAILGLEEEIPFEETLKKF